MGPLIRKRLPLAGGIALGGGRGGVGRLRVPIAGRGLRALPQVGGVTLRSGRGGHLETGPWAEP